mmetsp:Transcript_52027/g.113665  ORF Transcript_52027/g.113665 Transcript_52027/m.113665 type:complete len:287 (+) Transcript_52027:678-1538(+)
MMLGSRVSAITCCLTLLMTASRSCARVSSMHFRRLKSRPPLSDIRQLQSSLGSPRRASSGRPAALMAPQPSWPMTMSTFTFRWFTAYCSEPMVVSVTALPAQRTTNMSPRCWSKTISVGTRESEQLRIAVCGNCLLISARRSKALLSGRVAWPIQKRVLPRWSDSSTSTGVCLRLASCPASASLRASSMEKPMERAPSSLVSTGALARILGSTGAGGGGTAAICICISISILASVPRFSASFCIAQPMPTNAPQAVAHPAAATEATTRAIARRFLPSRLSKKLAET